MRTAIEELLRYDGSVKTTVRWALRDTEVGGETVKAGQRVLVGLSAANRCSTSTTSTGRRSSDGR